MAKMESPQVSITEKAKSNVYARAVIKVGAVSSIVGGAIISASSAIGSAYLLSNKDSRNEYGAGLIGLYGLLGVAGGAVSAIGGKWAWDVSTDADSYVKKLEFDRLQTTAKNQSAEIG